MTIRVTQMNHVQITVPGSAEEPSKHFYAAILGLEEILKPLSLRNRGGAWYRLGTVELHLSTEDLVADNRLSRRHVCLEVVDLAQAKEAMREAGVELIPDKQPLEGWRRFYVRDPGGNRIEIAEREMK